MHPERKLIMLPGPTNVPDRVLAAMLKPLMNHRSPDASVLYREVKEKAKKVFKTEGDMVILTSSGTGGVEASVKNLVRKGDKVIVPVFGEFSSRLADSVAQQGGEVIRVEAPLGSAPPLGQMEEAFERAKNPKAVYVVHNETSTGVAVHYMKEVGELCQRYGAFFVADAISSLGGERLPVDEWGVDICATCSQKCLAAPPGLALISVSPRARKFMVENPPGDLYFNLPRYFKYAEKGETPFTPSLPLFHALNEALEIVLQEGVEDRIERHRRAASAFYAGFGRLGLQPYAGPEFRSNTVIALRYPPGIDDKLFRGIMDERYHILLAGGFGEMAGKLFRMGCMGEVNGYHIAATLSAVSSSLSFLKGSDSGDEAVAAALKVFKA